MRVVPVLTAGDVCSSGYDKITPARLMRAFSDAAVYRELAQIGRCLLDDCCHLDRCYGCKTTDRISATGRRRCIAWLARMDLG